MKHTRVEIEYELEYEFDKEISCFNICRFCSYVDEMDYSSETIVMKKMTLMNLR